MISFFFEKNTETVQRVYEKKAEGRKSEFAKEFLKEGEKLMCTKKRFCELINLHSKTIYKTSQKERRRSGIQKKKRQGDEEVLLGIRSIIKDLPTYGYKRVIAYTTGRVRGFKSHFLKS